MIAPREDWAPLDDERGGRARHAAGNREPLMVVSYDISDPRRLYRVARHCADYGVRVQYSVFEMRVRHDLFEKFWTRLLELIEPTEDRVVAWRVCGDCEKDTRGAGTMVVTQKPEDTVYVF